LNDFQNKKCSNNRNLFHLACESGEFRLINHCFNNISPEEFNQLNELKESTHNSTPTIIAEDNEFNQKFRFFKSYAKQTTQEKNTFIHTLVKTNKTKVLRDFLEYLSDNRLIDTIGFGLKNNENKTALDIAIENKNYEAIYLLNHYELEEKTLNKRTYKNNRKEIDQFIKAAAAESVTESKEAKIRNLIFKGGGIKGLAYMGALERLTRNNEIDLKQIERIGGTSAGAITAVLLGCGYSLIELEDELKKIDFESLLMDSADKEEIKNFFNEAKGLFNGSFSIIGLLSLFYNNYSFISSSGTLNKIISKLTNKMGLFEGEKFRKWIEEKIQAKLGVINATFKDLQMKVSKEGSSKYKYIFLTGSNLSTGKCEIFSHLHSPNMIIADAVRISMSIPIFFNPHKCFIKDDQGKRVVDSNKKDSLYVDGGLLNNYPIRMSDTTRITDDSETNFINKETLGFKLVSSDLKSKYDSMFKDLKSADKRIDKFGTFLSMLVNFYKDSEETNHSDRIKDQERTIYIDNCGISPIEFDLKDSDKSNLINSGRKGVEDYFQMKRNKKSNILFWQPKVCYYIIDFLFF